MSRVRNPKNARFKGLVLPSFLEPPSASLKFKVHPDRALPKGQTWLAHSGRRARIKNLRNECRSILSSKDPEVIAAVDRVRGILKDDPEPEYGLYNILFAARRASDDTGASIPQTIDYMVKKWEEQDKKEPQT